MDQQAQSEKLDCYAIVELFGHARIAGRILETTIAGGAFLRVDVPAVGDKPAFTRFYGPSAIYSITPVDQATAERAVAVIHQPPVTVYIPAALPAPKGGFDYEDGPENDF